MPDLKDIKPIKPLRPTFPYGKTGAEEVGVFVMLVIVLLAAVIIAFWLGFIDEVLLLVGILAVLFFIYTRSPPLIIELKDYERAVIFRYGKFRGVFGPGWVFLAPFIDEPRVIDTRVISVDKEFTPQDVITRDNIKLVIDAVIFLRVKDPKAAVMNIQDPIDASKSYVTAHLRDVIGRMQLSEVISEVNKINTMLKEGLARVGADWGIEVSKVEIQSITLPATVQDAMHDLKASEQKKFAAKQEAEANEIRIDAVRKAAGRLSDPAMQYLYLEALKKMSEGRSSKIIFPIELTHLAERLSGRMGKTDRSELKDDLREAYDEFLLEEESEGRHPAEILKRLKKKQHKKK